MTTVFSGIHSNDFPMGVGKRNVCGGVDSFTLRLGRSICSNKGLDDEYDSSIWFMYHRSPPKRRSEVTSINGDCSALTWRLLKVHRDNESSKRQRHWRLVGVITSSCKWSGNCCWNVGSCDVAHLSVLDSRASKRRLPCPRSICHGTGWWAVHRFSWEYMCCHSLSWHGRLTSWMAVTSAGKAKHYRA